MDVEGIRIETGFVETLGGIDRLRDEWDALAAATPEATAFQSYAWCRAFIAVAAARAPRSIRARVLVVREDGRLVMLWPLQQLRFAGLRLVGWIGEPMTQYGDILAEAGPGRMRWRAAAEAELHRSRADLVLLKNQRLDGALAGCGAVPAEWSDAAGEAAPFLALDDAASDGIMAAQDRSLRRRARRLAQHGEVRLAEPAGEDERAALAREALRLKGEWLRSRRLFSSGLSHPLTGPFVERLARDGTLGVAALTVGDAPAAVELGLRDAGAYRSLLAAYDLRYAEGAPGHALTARLVASARERGLARFDFLAPADASKRRWASGEVRLRMTALPLTWRGWLGLRAFHLRPLAKRGLIAALRAAGRLRDLRAAAERPRLAAGLAPQTAR